MGLGKKLISNTTFLLIDFLTVSLFSYAFWSIVGKSQFLSTTDYGIVVIVVNASIILSSISFFGFSNILQKLIPEYIQKKKNYLINNLIRFSMKILLVTNLSLFLILTLFSNQIATFLKISPIDIILIGILTLATSLANFTGAVMQGFQDMKKIAITDTAGYFIKAAGTFILLIFIHSNIVPILVFVVALFFIFVTRLNLSWLRFRRGRLDYRELISNYAFPTFIAGIAWMIFTNAQYLILTVIQDPATTGVFSVASILTTLISTIPITMSTALFPILSQLSVSSKFRKPQEFLISKVLRYSFYITIPMALLFTFFSDKVIIIFSKIQFLGATSLFPVLSLAALISGVGMFLLTSLYAMKKIKQNRNIIVLTAAVFLSLSIILTKMFSSFGLAVAYTISVSVLLGASQYYLRKLVTITIPYKSILKNIIASVIWLAVYYFIAPFAFNNLFQLIFILASFLIYPVVLLPLKYYNNEDLKIIEFLGDHSPGIIKVWLGKAASIISKFSSAN